MRSTLGVAPPAEWSYWVTAPPALEWNHSCFVKTKYLDIYNDYADDVDRYDGDDDSDDVDGISSRH